MGSLYHSKCVLRREREDHKQAFARLVWPGQGGARGPNRDGAYVRHAREWSVEIGSIALRGRGFLFLFYFLCLGRQVNYYFFGKYTTLKPSRFEIVIVTRYRLWS